MKTALWLMGASTAAGLMFASGAALADREPLPQPLTLEQALSLADDQQPAVARARADVAYRQADRESAASASGVQVSLEGRLRWIEPSDIAPDQSREDHSASLYVRKNLYDFGRTHAREAAAGQRLEASRLHYVSTLSAQRVEIMERFFDVLLADMAFARDNEDLAVIYVTLDRLRQRHELGQVSDIDLFEMESDYQAVRQRQAASQAAQRATRARLAIALGRPGELPSDIAPPELTRPDRALPPYEQLLPAVLGENPVIKARRAELQAAEQNLAAARAGGRPYLDGQLEASQYAREMGSYDDWRAGLVLTVPLYQGGAVDAAVGKARAELDRARAALSEAEQAVRQQALELWLELQTLRVEADRVRALQDYRDLYLDRSRTLYELEVKADLGDAMVRLSEAQFAAAENRYERALAWSRLEALAGDALPLSFPGAGGE